MAEKFRLELLPQLLNSPLAPYIRPRTSQGNERLQFDRGGVLKLFAPNAESVHGFDGDAIYVDEAWSFDMLRGQALEAAARPTPLVSHPPIRSSRAQPPPATSADAAIGGVEDHGWIA